MMQSSSRTTASIRPWTGTLNGVPVSVVSTGMGCPSTAICLEELIACGADTFIRVGTAGRVCDRAFDPTLDGVINTAAVRDEGTTKHYIPIEYPAVARPPRCRGSGRLRQAARLQLHRGHHPVQGLLLWPARAGEHARRAVAEGPVGKHGAAAMSSAPRWSLLRFLSSPPSVAAAPPPSWPIPRCRRASRLPSVRCASSSSRIRLPRSNSAMQRLPVPKTVRGALHFWTKYD